MKVKALTLVAGVEVSLGAGNFFMLVDTTAPVSVRVMRGGSVVEEGEDVEAGYKAERPPWFEGDALYFDDARIVSDTAQTIRYGQSLGYGGYDRSLGEVTSEPKLTQSTAAPVGLDALVDNGFCFCGNVERAAVAAEYPHLQLFNPAANTKTLYVDAIVASQGLAGVLALKTYDTALTTLVAASAVINAKMGSSAGTAELRTDSLAAQVTDSNIQNNIQALVCAAEAPQYFVLPYPIILQPGKGIVVLPAAVNQSLYASFRWREYA